VTRVKICGITEFEDARDAALLGADAIGLNFCQSSPRYVEPVRAAKIIEKLPPFVTVVGVFMNHPDPQQVEDFAVSLGLHAVQLHGSESPDYCSVIQRVKVIKSFRVNAGFRIDTLRSYGNGTFLLDGCAPGTGRIFDWELAYGANAFGSVIIAGGLNAENVSQVVSTLHPFAVDVASSVESAPGKKDYEKMRRLIEAVERADVAVMGNL
jgi:phosphoribosylanthranilate isomerase